jgi:hypothetical protein
MFDRKSGDVYLYKIFAPKEYTKRPGIPYSILHICGFSEEDHSIDK